MSTFALLSFDLSSLPCVSLADKRRLPSCPAVYFALSATSRVLYIGRSVDIRERLRSHHRVPILEALGGVKIAWLEQRNILALPRLEETLIKYFNPPLNKIPAYLNKEESENLLKHLALTDRIHNDKLISINKFASLRSSKAKRKLSSSFEQDDLLPSEFKEIILDQAKIIENLEERLADLKLMVEEQMQTQHQLTETLVEQAKAISELSRAQTETNNRLSQITLEQALTISKLSSALEASHCEDKAED